MTLLTMILLCVQQHGQLSRLMVMLSQLIFKLSYQSIQMGSFKSIKKILMESISKQKFKLSILFSTSLSSQIFPSQDNGYAGNKLGLSVEETLISIQRIQFQIRHVLRVAQQNGRLAQLILTKAVSHSLRR